MVRQLQARNPKQPRQRRFRDTVQPTPRNREHLSSHIQRRIPLDPTTCIADHGSGMVSIQRLKATLTITHH